MYHYVYILETIPGYKRKTYVGYSNNVSKRISMHNSSKGAKATRGYKWKLIFKKRFLSKSKAMSYEYKIKKDRKTRLSIIKGLL